MDPREFARRRREMEEDERLREERRDRIIEINNTLKNDGQRFADNPTLALEVVRLGGLEYGARHADYMPGFTGFLVLATIVAAMGAAANGHVSIIGSVASVFGVTTVLAAVLHLSLVLEDKQDGTAVSCCKFVSIASIGIVAMFVAALWMGQIAAGILNIDLSSPK